MKNDINNDNNNDINNDNNILVTNNENNNSKQKIPFISNISVTINQFFDRFKIFSKEETSNTERIKMGNLNFNDEDEKNAKLEEKKNDNKYLINQRKKMPITKMEPKKVNDNQPINNIINIVVRNDNNTNNNKEERKNGILFNKFYNDK